MRGSFVRTVHPRWQSTPSVRVGALVATPGAIEDEARQLDTEVRGLRDEVLGQVLELGKRLGLEAAKKEPRWSFYYDQLLPFVAEWDAFFAEHQHWYENLWGATWEQLQAYRARLAKFRASAEALAFKFLAPSPTPPKLDSPLPMADRLLRGVGITAAGIAAVLLVSALRK